MVCESSRWSNSFLASPRACVIIFMRKARQKVMDPTGAPSTRSPFVTSTGCLSPLTILVENSEMQMLERFSLHDYV